MASEASGVLRRETIEVRRRELAAAVAAQHVPVQRVEHDDNGIAGLARLCVHARQLVTSARTRSCWCRRRTGGSAPSNGSARLNHGTSGLNQVLAFVRSARGLALLVGVPVSVWGIHKAIVMAIATKRRDLDLERGLVHGYLRARHIAPSAAKSFDKIITAISTLGGTP